MVPAVRGSDLDTGLASTFSDDVAAQHRDRSNARSTGTAANEPVCYRAMDGLSAVRSDRAADNDKLWHHCSVSSTSNVLGSLDSSKDLVKT